MSNQLYDFEIRRRVDDLLALDRSGQPVPRIAAFSEEQAVGHYVTNILKERHRRAEFYAKRLALSSHKLSKGKSPKVDKDSCPNCGYLDPALAPTCPMCDLEIERPFKPFNPMPLR